MKWSQTEATRKGCNSERSDFGIIYSSDAQRQSGILGHSYDIMESSAIDTTVSSQYSIKHRTDMESQNTSHLQGDPGSNLKEYQLVLAFNCLCSLLMGIPLAVNILEHLKES